MVKIELGLHAIYKPKGITSHDIVQRIKKRSGGLKTGHGGTLDPLASGVLVVAVGKEYTKQLGSFLKVDKEYIAVINLGANSETDDAEGPITKISDREPTKEQISNILVKFVGQIQQMPPKYSSVKRGGKPVHRYARQGKTITLGFRTVEIYEIELIQYLYPEIIIRVVCGSGTYIRSLARDIGEHLGTGAYLANLERTRVGEYTKENSILINN